MTPVGVFFICQNEDKCHFVNSTSLRRIKSYFDFMILSGNTEALIRSAGSTSSASAISKNTSSEKP